MDNEEIIEPLGQRTPGLTSASQIVNTTSSITFSMNNSTCAIPTHIPVTYPLEVEQREMKKEVLPPLFSRSEKFTNALEESMQKNKQILKELAKY
jgi:hypothetical protein